MTNEILDTNFSERINIRSKLLNWAELLLLSIHLLLFLASFYFIISDDSRSPIQYLILFLFSYPNLKFVYSSRNATLIYEETQNSKEINTAKKSKSRLVFICTGILLCLLSIAYINNLVSQASLPNMPNSSLSELDLRSFLWFFLLILKRVRFDILPKPY